MFFFALIFAGSKSIAVEFDPAEFPQICVGSLTTEQEQLPMTAVNEKLELALKVDEFLKIWFAKNNQDPPNAFVRLMTVNKTREMIEKDFNVIEILQFNQKCLDWLSEKTE
tara:strand:+ start:150 stop:482 length:333 start_codon:yes stop_codon:yes gene_type:complete